MHEANEFYRIPFFPLELVGLIAEYAQACDRDWFASNKGLCLCTATLDSDGRKFSYHSSSQRVLSGAEWAVLQKTQTTNGDSIQVTNWGYWDSVYEYDFPLLSQINLQINTDPKAVAVFRILHPDLKAHDEIGGELFQEILNAMYMVKCKDSTKDDISSDDLGLSGSSFTILEEDRSDFESNDDGGEEDGEEEEEEEDEDEEEEDEEDEEEEKGEENEEHIDGAFTVDDSQRRRLKRKRIET